MTYDFFLSHSSRLDSRANRYIRAVANRLEERGCDVFLDVNSLGEGSLLGPAIRAAIDGARVGVVMYSTASTQSMWVQYEISRMFKQKVMHAMSIWLLCMPSAAEPPDWIKREDVLRADDYRSAEAVADAMVRRFNKLNAGAPRSAGRSLHVSRPDGEDRNRPRHIR